LFVAYQTPFCMSKDKNLTILLLSLANLLVAGAFIADLFMPLGFGIGVPYLMAMFITLSLRDRRLTIVGGVVISAFLLIGYLIHSTSGSNLVDLGYRVLVMMAIWLAVFIIIRYKFSEEKVISNMLDKHQEKLDALFENATEGMIITNDKGEIVLLNPKAEEQFGYDKGELVGQKIEVLVPNKNKPGHEGYRNGFFKNPHARPMGHGRDLNAKHKSGSEFPVEISLSNFDTDEGMFVIAFVIDITERKKQESLIRKTNEELQQSIVEINTLNSELEQRVEARTTELEQSNISLLNQIREKEEAEMALIDNQQLLSTIAKNFPNGIIQVLDEELRYVFVDGKDMHNLHLTSDGLIGKPLSSVIPPTKIDLIEQQLKKVFSGENVSFEVEMFDGTYVFHAVPLTDTRGAIKQVLAVLQNITQQKLAEEALINRQKLFKTIAQNFPNGIISVLDDELNCVFIEGEELEAFGRTADEMVGSRIATLFESDDVNQFEQELQRVFKGHRISLEVEVHGRSYILNAVPLSDTRNAISQVLLVSQNITELKKAEEEIRKALAREKELNELKSIFVSTASHEFRTPLSTILSSASLISKYNKPGDDEKRMKHIERIKSSVSNLIGILNDFLSISKIEEGKILVQPTEFSVINFCEDLKEEMQPSAKEGQTIEFSFEGDSPIVLLDKHVLKNVLLNLVSNAIKYSPEHKPIYLKTYVNGQDITFIVQDKGYGIPEQDQKFIFDTFFRANNVTGIQGTGLGLNIVKKYIEMMKGTISFTSKEAEGTIFTVKLKQFEPGIVVESQEADFL
jgi:PAS domain S-box-containing protein